MDSDERRRTGRVNGEARPSQSQYIGDPPGAGISAAPLRHVKIQLPRDRRKARDSKSLIHWPIKTPVRVPSSLRTSCPASSRASHAVSSNKRCCGSSRSASRGETPKNSASNSSTRSRNPPHRLAIRPGVAARGSKYWRTSMRSGGISVIASLPSQRSCQKLAVSVTPPGNRQPIPTIATGMPRGLVCGSLMRLTLGPELALPRQQEIRRPSPEPRFAQTQDRNGRQEKHRL